ncbi:hypothetical protein PoB_007604400 [Plakobranchus ocellatus]|uniref:Uncharacterized protein n=1 Tax=Plakobranchus ocellatus TaxID=259542 RepID=A0AAV4DZ98_9GAST|nr:hypothetical protein PoB_007604400 [Plakobranchus ocellatus]
MLPRTFITDESLPEFTQPHTVHHRSSTSLRGSTWLITNISFTGSQIQVCLLSDTLQVASHILPYIHSQVFQAGIHKLFTYKQISYVFMMSDSSNNRFRSHGDLEKAHTLCCRNQKKNQYLPGVEITKTMTLQARPGLSQDFLSGLGTDCLLTDDSSWSIHTPTKRPTDNC